MKLSAIYSFIESGAYSVIANAGPYPADKRYRIVSALSEVEAEQKKISMLRDPLIQKYSKGKQSLDQKEDPESYYLFQLKFQDLLKAESDLNLKPVFTRQDFDAMMLTPAQHKAILEMGLVEEEKHD
jgi:hypothetical protein